MHKLFIFLSLIAATPLLSDSASKVPDFKNVRRQITDGELREKINNFLRRGRNARIYAFVQFEVDRGYVYLEGHLSSEMDRNILEAKISEIQGVAGIKNDVRIYEIKSKFQDQTYYPY